MHSNLAQAATLAVIFTAALAVGAWKGADSARFQAAKQGYFAYCGHLYQVTGIRPRGSDERL